MEDYHAVRMQNNSFGYQSIPRIAGAVPSDPKSGKCPFFSAGDTFVLKHRRGYP